MTPSSRVLPGIAQCAGYPKVRVKRGTLPSVLGPMQPPGAGLAPSCSTRRLGQTLSRSRSIRDIVGLCVNPPEGALVLCVEEKSQIQALDRTAPVLPLGQGLPERRTHD